MNTQNCLLCEKVFKDMKGKLMIVVNEPKDSICPAPVNIKDISGNIDVTISTASTYIIDIKKETDICAYYCANFKSCSDYIHISPNEFTYLEVDYEYFIFLNQHRVQKVSRRKIIRTTVLKVKR